MRQYHISLFFLLFASGLSAACASDSELISRAKLIDDSRQLLTLLETVHPQPYLNGGGKILFHKRFQDVVSSIPEAGMTREDFRGLLSPFMASVGDGHTMIYPDMSTDFSAIPLLFYVVEDDLYVSAVLEDIHQDLLGARLIAVEGVAFDEIVDRARKYYGADNLYGTLAQLANFELFLAKKPIVKDLLPEWEDDSFISVSFAMPDGSENSVQLPSYARETLSFVRPPNGIELPPLDGREFVWAFLDEEHKVAYLRVRAMVENRETYEKRATYSDISDDVRDYYESLYGKKATGATDEVVASIPSLTDTYSDLVRQMKNARTKTLILDLRTNVGGWAYPADMLVYYIYGRSKLIELHRKTNIAIRKLSPYYFASEPDVTLAQLNDQRNIAGSALMLNKLDYDFSDIENIKDNRLRADYAKNIVESDLALSRTFYEEYSSGAHSGFYEPENVVVLVDVATYSAGLMFAQYMKLMGATTIGTTPSQNIIQLGETVSYKLENSKLGGDISHSLLIHDADLNYEDNADHLMKPDFELTYDKLKSYDFARNAAVLYALELFGPEPR